MSDKVRAKVRSRSIHHGKVSKLQRFGRDARASRASCPAEWRVVRDDAAIAHLGPGGKMPPWRFAQTGCFPAVVELVPIVRPVGILCTVICVAIL